MRGLGWLQTKVGIKFESQKQFVFSIIMSQILYLSRKLVIVYLTFKFCLFAKSGDPRPKGCRLGSPTCLTLPRTQG